MARRRIGGGSGYRWDGDVPLGGEPASALVKVGCRYYDPLFGVFLTRDTVLGEKPYAYCDGDPVNFSDPAGRTKKPLNWWQILLKSILGGGISGYVHGGGISVQGGGIYINQGSYKNGKGGGQQQGIYVIKPPTIKINFPGFGFDGGKD